MNPCDDCTPGRDGDCAKCRAILEEFCAWVWEQYMAAYCPDNDDVDEFLSSRKVLP